jgi:hypothetical protein
MDTNTDTKALARRSYSYGRWGALVSVALVASLATLLAVRARAAGIPDADVLTYTGYLEGADGQPLTSELSSIGLEVWDAAEAGERVCDTSVEGVTPQAGRFQLVLPAECVDAVKATPNLWVDVKVEGASLGRTKLGAVPYAIEAGHAHSADGALTAEASGHATSADVANNAGGPLKAALDSLTKDVAKVTDLRVSYKGGNNGTQTCNAFCLNENFLPLGTCFAAKQESNGAFLSCDQKPATGNLLCWCASP